MQILSYEPLAIKKGELKEAYTWRFQFTKESPAEVEAVLNSFLSVGYEQVDGVAFKSVL